MIRRLLPLLIFAALASILLWPVLFGGRVLLPGAMLGKMAPWNATAQETTGTYWNALTWDSIAYFHPSRALLGRALRAGELPLWNPYQMCGVPFLANFQSAVLYPPNWIFALMPTAGAFGLLAFLHLFAAGSFTYLFLRGLGLGRTASTFGGVAFMLSGFAITWLELPVFLSTAVWLPLALHYSRSAHDTGRGRYTAIAGIAIALSLLGGHPQIAFYCLLAVGLYWVYLGASGRRTTSVFRTLVLAGLTFGFGFALAAPQLLPAMELARLSHRGGTIPTAEGYAAYSALAMPWRNLVSLFIPYFFGSPAQGSLTQFAEYCGYIGVIPLILIGMAFTGKARRHTWFFGGLLVLSLMMALGTGVNRLFYFGVPGFANSGSPSRALFLFTFSAVVLGAIGLDRFVISADKRGIRVTRILYSAGAMLFLGLLLTHWNLRQFVGEYSEGALFASIASEFGLFVLCLVAGTVVLTLTALGRVTRQMGGALILVILAADLLMFGMQYNPTCEPSEVYSKAETVRTIMRQPDRGRVMPLNDQWSLADFPNAVLPPNAGTAYGMFDVQGYDALYPARYKALLDAVGGRDSCPPENGNMLFARNPGSPVWDLLGVRWMVSSDPVPGARTMADGCYVLRNADALPRAFLVHAIEYADDEEVLRRMTNGEFDPRTAVLADMDDAEQLDPWKLDLGAKPEQPAEADVVVISSYSCNRVSLNVRANEPGILVLTDQYYPGWTAHVDGKLMDISQVDYALRGIPVREGTHKVELSYEPESFEKGMRLMKVAFVILAGFAIYSAVRMAEDRKSGSRAGST